MTANLVCAIHGKIEPVFRIGLSTVCFECHHTYPDDDAIMAAFKELMDDRNGEQFAIEVKIASVDATKIWTAADIPFCPLCLHDW